MSIRPNEYAQHACLQGTTSHLPSSSNNFWYRYQYLVSVAEHTKRIGIGSIGKLWYRSQPKRQ